MQAASPGLPLVGRVRRHIEITVYARGFEGLRVCLGISAEACTIAAKFSATICHEDYLYLLLERSHVGDIRRSDTATAENADVRELVEIGESNLPGLHSAHREARHGTVGLIRKGAEVGSMNGIKSSMRTRSKALK